MKPGVCGGHSCDRSHSRACGDGGHGCGHQTFLRFTPGRKGGRWDTWEPLVAARFFQTPEEESDRCRMAWRGSNRGSSWTRSLLAAFLISPHSPGLPRA